MRELIITEEQYKRLEENLKAERELVGEIITLKETINEIRAGKIVFKSDKQCGIHVGVGKRSFSKEQIVENARHIIEAVNHGKPNSVKGALIKSLSLSTTMGPGIKISV